MHRILIFDDQEKETLLMFNILEKSGYDCYPKITEGWNVAYREFKEKFKYYLAFPTDVSKVEKLEQAIREIDPALFIVDIQLITASHPKTEAQEDNSGKSLAKDFLLEKFSEIPILYVTQHPGKEVDEIKRDYMDDFLQKVNIGSIRMKDHLENNLPLRVEELLCKSLK